MTTTHLICALGIAAALATLTAACGKKEPKIEDQPLEPTIEAPAGAGPASPAYYGVWAAKDDWCDIPPGSADPAPIAITANEFLGYENRCRVGEAEEGTEGGWRLALVCDEEGVETVAYLDLDLDGEMLRMRRDGGLEVALVRCGD